MARLSKPTVKLTERDGNALAIVGRCHQAAKQDGWSHEEWEAVRDEMLNGDYDELLQTVIKYFDVE